MIISIINILIVLIFPSIVFADSNENEFEKGIQFYEKKEYVESFPIFLHTCNYGDYGPSCLYLGISYLYGRGVEKNPNKALQIFKKYSNVHDSFKSWEAFTLEYADGSDKSMNEAMEINRILANSNIDWIAKQSKDALARIPIYNFLGEYIKIQDAYKNKKIKYDKFHQLMIDITTNYLPNDLRDKFIAMRDICLKNAKNAEDTFWDGAVNVGKTMAKSFVGGWVGLGESAIELFSEASDKFKVDDECKKCSKYFIDELNKYELSNNWVNRQ